MEYQENGGAVIPLRVHTVVISVQHTKDIELEELRHQLKERVVKVQYYFPHAHISIIATVISQLSSYNFQTPASCKMYLIWSTKH